MDRWAASWRRSGALFLLLDFDGTLAPLASRPETVVLPPDTRAALERLRRCPGVSLAVVSGRALEDVRERVAVAELACAGNHGMEISGWGVEFVHPDADAVRTRLQAIGERLARHLGAIPGAWVEDKRLTLSVHCREVARQRVAEVRALVQRVVGTAGEMRLTEGKEVVEVRPAARWGKGHAVELLLAHRPPPPGAPVLYLGDDATDEDAFRALAARSGAAGVIVADPVPPLTSARSFLRNPSEVAALLSVLADGAP